MKLIFYVLFSLFSFSLIAQQPKHIVLWSSNSMKRIADTIVECDTFQLNVFESVFAEERIAMMSEKVDYELLSSMSYKFVDENGNELVEWQTLPCCKKRFYLVYFGDTPPNDNFQNPNNALHIIAVFDDFMDFREDNDTLGSYRLWEQGIRCARQQDSLSDGQWFRVVVDSAGSKINSVISVKNGYLNGIFKEYSEDQSLHYLAKYKNGYLVDTSYLYFNNSHTMTIYDDSCNIVRYHISMNDSSGIIYSLSDIDSGIELFGNEFGNYRISTTYCDCQIPADIKYFKFNDNIELFTKYNLYLQKWLMENFRSLKKPGMADATVLKCCKNRFLNKKI